MVATTAITSTSALPMADQAGGTAVVEAKAVFGLLLGHQRNVQQLKAVVFRLICYLGRCMPNTTLVLTADVAAPDAGDGVVHAVSAELTATVPRSMKPLKLLDSFVFKTADGSRKASGLTAPPPLPRCRPGTSLPAVWVRACNLARRRTAAMAWPEQ